MHLTLHTDYALRTLLYLAIHPERVVPVGTVAQAYGISRDHAAKVAKSLVKLGYVTARRGQAGGLQLARAPEAIRLGALVRASENLDIIECFDAKTSTCPITNACRLQDLLEEATAAFLAVIDRYTLADLMKNRAQLGKLLPIVQPAMLPREATPRPPRLRARG